MKKKSNPQNNPETHNKAQQKKKEVFKKGEKSKFTFALTEANVNRNYSHMRLVTENSSQQQKTVNKAYITHYYAL